MRIAICDDEMEARKRIEKCVSNYCGRKGLKLEVCNYASAEELKCALFDYDILFLDIMLDHDNDGTLVGQELRKMGNTALFIITTSRTDRYADAIEATIFRYLIKPFEQSSVDKALDQAAEHLRISKQTLPVVYRQRTDYVKITDIILIESYMRKRYIYTKDRKFQTSETIPEIADRLKNEDCFYRLQKSFLINLAHIESSTKTCVTMDNGRDIRYLKGKYDEFQNKFTRYLADQI